MVAALLNGFGKEAEEKTGHSSAQHSLVNRTRRSQKPQLPSQLCPSPPSVSLQPAVGILGGPGLPALWRESWAHAMGQAESSWVVDGRSFIPLCSPCKRPGATAYRLWKPKQEPEWTWAFSGSFSSLQTGTFIDSAESPSLVRLSGSTRAERTRGDAGINPPRAPSQGRSAGD